MTVLGEIEKQMLTRQNRPARPSHPAIRNGRGEGLAESALQLPARPGPLCGAVGVAGHSRGPPRAVGRHLQREARAHPFHLQPYEHGDREAREAQLRLQLHQGQYWELVLDRVCHVSLSASLSRDGPYAVILVWALRFDLIPPRPVS